MSIINRCGTGDTGCTGPAICHMSDNMCNGVFAPVCAPEICNVPRIPHHEKLVEGEGRIQDNYSQQNIYFKMLVEREMQVYKGVFKLEGVEAGIEMKAEVLKFFESDGKTYMLALLHEKSTGKDMMVKVYQNEGQAAAQFFIYMIASEGEPTSIVGALVEGSIKFYVDHNGHEH